MFQSSLAAAFLDPTLQDLITCQPHLISRSNAPGHPSLSRSPTSNDVITSLCQARLYRFTCRRPAVHPQVSTADADSYKTVRASVKRAITELEGWRLEREWGQAEWAIVYVRPFAVDAQVGRVAPVVELGRVAARGVGNGSSGEGKGKVVGMSIYGTQVYKA